MAAKKRCQQQLKAGARPGTLQEQNFMEKSHVKERPNSLGCKSSA